MSGMSHVPLDFIVLVRLLCPFDGVGDEDDDDDDGVVNVSIELLNNGNSVDTSDAGNKGT